LNETVARGEFVLMAVPSQFLRGVAVQMRGALRPGTPVVSCSKGIELGSGALMPEVIAEAGRNHCSACRPLFCERGRPRFDNRRFARQRRQGVRNAGGGIVEQRSFSGVRVIRSDLKPRSMHFRNCSPIRQALNSLICN